MSSAGPLSTQVTVSPPQRPPLFVGPPSPTWAGLCLTSHGSTLVAPPQTRSGIPEPRLLDGCPVTAHKCSEFTLPHCSPSRCRTTPSRGIMDGGHKLQDLFVLQYPRSPAHPDRAARSSQFLRDTQRLIGQLACAHAIYLRRVAMIDQKADVDAIVAEAVASLSTDEYWRRGSTLCSSPGLPAPGDHSHPSKRHPFGEDDGCNLGWRWIQWVGEHWWLGQWRWMGQSAPPLPPVAPPSSWCQTMGRVAFLTSPAHPHCAPHSATPPIFRRN
ncbi:hypothetical protein B0H13DRAFT_1884164 [Mycena leptocephala]|nr:hypothetical protein B0H13DRAFT_1884164 [Mycena leptocephala]